MKASTQDTKEPVEDGDSNDSQKATNEDSIRTIEIGVEECDVLINCLQRRRADLLHSNYM